MTPSNETSQGFLGYEEIECRKEQSLFHIIPVPFEKSVSYGTGTARGPAAIIAASQQLELFNGRNIPAHHGICTHQAMACDTTPEKLYQEIENVLLPLLRDGRKPILLGGEHSITFGIAKTLSAMGVDCGMVQFDAHADLRDSYQGSKTNHACIMRRIYETGMPIYQIGIRSYSPEERIFIQRNKCSILHGYDILRDGLRDLKLPEPFPKKIFVTIDIDALDPAIMPATGTPEPGGLSWLAMMDALSLLARQREIIGFDVVEFAPISGFHAPDFTVARLIYNFMGMLLPDSDPSDRRRVDSGSWDTE